MVLKGNQDPLLLPCECHIGAKVAVLFRGMTYLTAYSWAYTS